MCGIFGYIGPRKNAAELVLEGLKTLEYRGYDSWGVGVVPLANPKNTILVKKKAGKIGDGTVKEIPQSSLAFGHTRWATHGGVTDENAHPHLDCTQTIALIHNGIIENYDELKKTLLKKGHRFISETDTEVAVHLIEDFCKTMSFEKAFQKAFGSFEGLNAIIAIKYDERKLLAARNGSPLVVGFGKKENLIASDAMALLPYTKTVHFLEDDEMAVVTDGHIDIRNVRTGTPVSSKKQQLNWSVTSAEKGVFPFFMLKEIHEQPEHIDSIAQSAASQALKVAATIKKSYGTYMVGCGSASYACLAGSYLFSKVARRHVNWAIGSEFGYHLDFLTPKSCVIAISQSGETMDILEGVKKAKEQHARLIALVNVVGSSLYRLADEKLLLGVGPEKSVASTKALTGMIAHLVLLSYALANNVKAGQHALELAAISGRLLLTSQSIRQFQSLAKKLKNSEHIYVIGRGLSYPTALETAMKIKEISYIHAEGLAAGELKHGPLALVTRGTPCIAFLPNDETYGANLAGAMEMKARGGYLIGISYKPHEIFDEYIEVKDAGVATIIPNIIAGQLLAYYLTIQKGLDPDKPRNLAKSVTVK
jgi:glucosamine--fructose-6-phosphate aminotransferase (isomerizing)